MASAYGELKNLRVRYVASNSRFTGSLRDAKPTSGPPGCTAEVPQLALNILETPLYSCTCRTEDKGYTYGTELVGFNKNEMSHWCEVFNECGNERERVREQRSERRC